MNAFRSSFFFILFSLLGCVPQTPEDVLGASSPVSPTSPTAVIRNYYAAVNTHKFREAYMLWERNGAASGQTFRAFAAGFAETKSVTVKVGKPGRIEGAAGSRYVTIPVTISAMTTGGKAQYFSGRYTLRRTVVDSATAEQRRWHLYSADISATQ